jgi:hypothetical protein
MYVAKVGEQVHGAKLSPDVVYTDLRACILICGKCVLYPSAPDSIIGFKFRIILALWFRFFFSFFAFFFSSPSACLRMSEHRGRGLHCDSTVAGFTGMMGCSSSASRSLLVGCCSRDQAGKATGWPCGNDMDV